MSSVIKNVKSHNHCIMCGSKNPASFNLNFLKDGRDSVSCKFRGDCNCQGYEGILHGGVISALLDSAMTHCLFAKNIEAVTGKMNIRFLKQIPFDTEYTLKAEIAGNKSPLYKLKAFLLKKEEVYAKAEAKFIDLKFINKQSVNRAVRQK